VENCEFAILCNNAGRLYYDGAYTAIRNIRILIGSSRSKSLRQTHISD